ncbi:DUF397 domain-containing protein [Streptomyces sp. ISL-87]|uniref:DUF397 domain-containing protein n=1 Tax=unclassified Streptomyces TaxID=2593676 RepID=UPI0027E5712B|nr:DUF397 domain-containing protein [Streptomyces sp. ISL-87]
MWARSSPQPPSDSVESATRRATASSGSTTELAWFKSGYSGSSGDTCVEVALSPRPSSSGTPRTQGSPSCTCPPAPGRPSPPTPETSASDTPPPTPPPGRPHTMPPWTTEPDGRETVHRTRSTLRGAVGHPLRIRPA